jgi:hypothetical protein
VLLLTIRWSHYSLPDAKARECFNRRYRHFVATSDLNVLAHRLVQGLVRDGPTDWSTDGPTVWPTDWSTDGPRDWLFGLKLFVIFLTPSSKVKQSLYTLWRRLGERRYSSYSFTTSALDGGEWSASRPGRALPSDVRWKIFHRTFSRTENFPPHITSFTPGERTPGTHWRGGWVDPRAGLHTEARGKILCPCRGSNPDRPVVQPVVRHYTA